MPVRHLRDLANVVFQNWIVPKSKIMQARQTLCFSTLLDFKHGMVQAIGVASDDGRRPLTDIRGVLLRFESKMFCAAPNRLAEYVFH